LVHPTRYWFIWNGVTASEATNMPSRSSRMSGSEVAVEDMSRRPREAGARREARLARNAAIDSVQLYGSRDVWFGTVDNYIA